MGNLVVGRLRPTSPHPRIVRSDAEWRALLPPAVFAVARGLGGTEPASSGELEDEMRRGLYRCRCCDAVLFSSGHKYTSGCGWPAFWTVVPSAVRYAIDDSANLVRTEVRCRSCDAHLGHVFEDGPKALGGLRYCVNSLCLAFAPSNAEPAPVVLPAAPEHT